MEYDMFLITQKSSGVKHMFWVPYCLTVPIGQTKLRICSNVYEKLQCCDAGSGVCVWGGMGGRVQWSTICILTTQKSSGVKHVF